ncbi:MAG: FecCD family ABC transporter permease [Bacteroidia bacterium]
MNKKHTTYFFILGILLVLLFVLELMIGSQQIPLNEIISSLVENNNTPENFIVKELRLSRAITSILAGAGLATSGLIMQSLFKNGLAGPYVLGISSGSGLGVALLLMAGTALGINIDYSFSVVIASSLGSMLVLVLILFISFRVRQAASLLIIGVMIGTFASAIISVLQFFTDLESLKKFVLWTMGSTTGTSLEQNLILTVFVLIGILIAAFLIKPLNTFLMGEEYAQSLGISIKSTRLLSILSVALLAGSITAYCGPIAFIGLAVPHIARNLFKTALHQILLPASIFLGSCLMLMCDIVAQVPGYDYVLPINAVTSLIGAPIVISVILKNRNIA